MTVTTPTYDLMMLLDPEADETARAKVLADTVTTIEGQGEMVHQDDWGERPLAYPIDRRKGAQYHLLQFQTDDKALLSGLERTLHITDGVLRFRLIKLRRGVPAPPDMHAGSAAVRRAQDEERERAEEGERAPHRRSTEDAGAAERYSEQTPAATPEEPAQG
jgi:small subunit ribosomal protein S6